MVIQFDHVSKYFKLEFDRPRSFQERFVSLSRRKPHNAREQFWALRDVSFGIERGETVGLIGENGAGKSTALKLMARIVPPTSGRIDIDGQVSALLELGTGFHPDLTGRENVFLNGSLYGFGRKTMNKLFGSIADFAELGEFIDIPVRNYSSGMYVRLAFAVAVHLTHEVLLVDEVLAVGDEAFQHKCMDKIGAFRRAGKTIVLVSHSLGAVRDLCQRVIWLEEGSIRADGPAREVLDQYLVSANIKNRDRVERERAAESAESDAASAVEAEPSPSENLWRWGSGEAEITGVQFCDADRQPRTVFTVGEAMVIRMTYQTHQPIAEPVLGIAIYRADDVHITGPNSMVNGLPLPPVIDGKGSVECVVPDLPLLAGNYELTVALHDTSCSGFFDYHHRHYPFTIQPRSVWDTLGVVALPCRFSHQAGEEPGDPT